MNLNDALLTDTAAHSFVELTLSPFFEREWPSAYAACKDGCIDRDALRKVRLSYAPKPVLGKRLVLAGDASSIARPALRIPLKEGSGTLLMMAARSNRQIS
jgi:hypothetical protein